MNTSIAASSLLGFGNKEASVAFQEFGVTLEKIYVTQEKQLKEEETSRKSVTDEINKEQRDKKKRESDLTDILSGGKKDSTRTKSGAKKKKGSLLSKILLGAGAVLAGKVLFDAVTDQVFDGMGETMEDMKDYIGDTLDKILDPIRNLVGDGNNNNQPENTDSPPPEQQSSNSGGSRVTTAPATFNLIASGEGGYNSVNRGTAGDTPGGAKSVMGRDLTEMTVGEVVDAQQSDELFAVGKYQIIPKTMTGFLKYMGIKENDKFDISTQEKFPKYVLEKKRPAVGDYLSGKSNDRKEAIQALAREFAAVGIAYPEAGRQRGQSRYAGTSGNAASITPEQMGKALDRDRKKLQKGGQVSEKDSKFPTKKLKQSKSNQAKLDQPRKGDGPPSEQVLTKNSFMAMAQKKQKGGKIFMHWTGMSYDTTPGGYYHTIVQGSGKVNHLQSYDKFNTPKGHTWRRNSTGVGISMASMEGGSYGPPGSGNWENPPTQAQIDATAKEVASIAKMWGWSKGDIRLSNVMTHAEAASLKDGSGLHPNYGVGSGDSMTKWDLIRLTKNAADWTGGDIIRAKAQSYFDGVNPPENPEVESSSPSSTGPGPSAALGPGVTSSSGGVSSSAPAAPTSFDGIFESIAAKVLAPVLSALGGIASNIMGGGGDEETSGENTSGDTGSVQVSGGLDKKMSAVLGSYEGLRTEAYADAVHGWSVPTIGIGATYYPEGFRLKGKVKQGDTITKDEAYEIKAAHVKEHRGRLLKEIGSGTYNKLPNNVKFALESVVFNYGSLSGASGQLAGLVKGAADTGDFSQVSALYRNKLANHNGGINSWRRNDEAGIIDSGKSQRTGIEFKTKLQQGGMVGQEINTGRMKGIQNAHMAKLRESQQKMRRRGPKIIQVAMPPMPQQAPTLVESESFNPETLSMKVSEIADYNRRIAMGALA